MDNVAEHSTRNRGKEKVDVEAREKGKRVVKQEEGGVGMTIKQRKPYVDVVIKEERKLWRPVILSETSEIVDIHRRENFNAYKVEV
ncbi:hypothetical protein L1049_018747 [Liquidambar formosana]|uniref:Uncharacterized protein n=1 Tax=Liquidambar formosana TaxID=63359 RepID=A0AAP0RB47_LIQFO